jgi:hypothetical protein
MYNEIINELTLLDKVELIACNIKRKETSMTMIYTIVIDGNNVLEDINTYKKVIAIMEIIKELFTKRNIKIIYNIKSANFLEEEIINKTKSTINNINDAEIIYSKDGYFEELNENVNSKKHLRA